MEIIGIVLIVWYVVIPVIKYFYDAHQDRKLDKQCQEEYAASLRDSQY